MKRWVGRLTEKSPGTRPHTILHPPSWSDLISSAKTWSGLQHRFVETLTQGVDRTLHDYKVWIIYVWTQSIIGSHFVHSDRKTQINPFSYKTT